MLLANLRVDGTEATYRVRVRNLSAGGMMAESDAPVARGSRVDVELRSLGWVEGGVAWRQGNRFGIAFVDPIDPVRVREPFASRDDDLIVPRRFQPIPQAGPDPEKLRKI